MENLYAKYAEDMLIKARAKTDMICETSKPGLHEWYARQAESYTRIAEAYMKLAELK